MNAAQYRLTPPVSHHGQTLGILGRAAEYLHTETEGSSHREAIHLLKRFGREVFDDYISSHQQTAARGVRQNTPISEAA